MNSLSRKKYLNLLKEQIALSKKKKLEQLLHKPFHLINYFLYSRLPFLTERSINGSATLFFGKKIKGIFPDSVFGYLYLYGFLEEDLTNAFTSLVKEGMTVLDIGAHVGYFSALASVLVGKSGSVHAFEATPRTYNLLHENMQQFKNVKTNHAAVWSEKKDLDFFDYGPFYAQCNSFTKAKLTKEILKKTKPEKIVVKTVTIDTYCKTNRVKPDFIKIDAESAEYEILRGMQDVLKKYKPILSLEVGDLKIKGNKNSKDCITFLKKFGYVPYDYINNSLEKHIVKKDYYGLYINLLFIPKGKN
jgi:FkbM family methyltransferase